MNRRHSLHDPPYAKHLLTRTWPGRIAAALFLIAFLNFTAFWIVALCIGGDAMNGKVQAGRYYLANHGKYTEVTQCVWAYSKIHTISVWITHPLALLGGGGLIAYAHRKAQWNRQP